MKGVLNDFYYRYLFALQRDISKITTSGKYTEGIKKMISFFPHTCSYSLAMIFRYTSSILEAETLRIVN